MAATAQPIAFLGLGAMGHAMSLSLLRSSFPVIGFDISSKTLDSFMSAADSIPNAQAKVTGSPAEACKSTQLALVMVANQIHIESALLAPETGAIHTLPKNAAIVVHATVSPTYIIGLRQRLDNKLGRPDLILIDAPVSGGVARSTTGTLTIMASSTKLSDLERPDVRAALNALSDNGQNLYIFNGGLGSGLKLKALNQVNCGINITAASEIMGLAAVFGLDTQKFYDTIKSRQDLPQDRQSGFSWMFLDRGPRMLTTTPKMASATGIIVKDVGIVVDEANQRSCDLPLVKKAQSVLASTVDAGMVGEDDSCVVKAYLGATRSHLVIDRAVNPSELTQQEFEEKSRLVCLAHDVVLLMGAYQTCLFAEALGMTSPEQVKEWVKIIGGAAGGSPVFSRAMQAVFADIFVSVGKKQEDDMEEKFRKYGKNTALFDGQLSELDNVIKIAEEQSYDPVLVKEAKTWLAHLLED